MTSITSQLLPYAFRRASGVILVLVLLFPIFAFGQKKPADEIQIHKCWEYRYDGSADAKLATDGNSIFFVRDGSIVEAVSTDNGKEVWSSDVGGSVDSNLLVGSGNVFLVRRAVSTGSEKAESIVVRALSASTGITKWNAAVAGEGEFTLGTIGGQIIAISQSGRLQGFGLVDGTDKWSRQFNTSIGTLPLFAGGRAYFVLADTDVRSILPDGGEPAAVGRSKIAISALGGLDDETIIWGDERGNLTSLRSGSGQIDWQFKSGARISEIIRVDGLVLAASNDNFVYAISPGSGDRVWKKRVPGRIRSIQAIGDETVLIQTIGEHNVILLHAKNGKSAGQVAFRDDELPVETEVIAAGKIAVLTDQALYFYGLGTCSEK